MKQFICDKYYIWRTNYLREIRKNKPLGSLITLKMPLPDQLDIVEEAIRRFNKKERVTRSIEATFCMANQDPWCESQKECMENLSRLETSSLYKTAYENQTAVELTLESE